MSGPLFDSHPLVVEYLALFLAVTPQTPWDDLKRVSVELWHLCQRAEREVPGAIGAALDRLTKEASKKNKR